MTRPVLEYTYIAPFTLSGGAADIPLTAPTGLKPIVTLLVSGTGSTTGLGGCAIAGVGPFEIAGNLHIGGDFAQLWIRQNVSITGSTTLHLAGSGGEYGGVEVGYWDATNIQSSFSEGPFTGLIGGTPPPGFPFAAGEWTADDLLYGVMLGTPSTPTWTLAGGPTMETIYPNHATLPPQYTNNQTVAVGAVTQAGAPKVSCGFVREPQAITTEVPFAFAFSATTTWNTYWWKVTGQAAVPAVPSRLATILG